MKAEKLDWLGRIVCGDNVEVMSKLPDGCIQCCITSPPYWGLRDYGIDGQLGLEATPEAYVAAMVRVFQEVKRVLRDDGTLWLNLGDSYAGSGKGNNPNGKQSTNMGTRFDSPTSGMTPFGLKPKDLIGIPWRVAFALQADGWYLRQDIIWHKPNPMPESVTDRCTKSHEYIFLLSKSQQYYYNHEAIKEPATTKENRPSGVVRDRVYEYDSKLAAMGRCRGGKETGEPSNRNKRSVWTVSTEPYAGAHFATFPTTLIKPCVMAGSKAGDIILDPFSGAATTALVAKEMNRQWCGIEINPEYCALSNKRLAQAILQLETSSPILDACTPLENNLPSTNPLNLWP